METKEVAVSQSTAVAINQPGGILKELGMSASDISIAKILLMQKTSLRVNEETSQFGDLIHQRTGEKLGDFEKPIEIIPIKTFKNWVVFNTSGGEPEFVRIDPFSEELPWEFQENGVSMRRDQCINVMCLLADSVKNGDDPFPFTVSFKRMSYQAGKDLLTNIMKSRMFGKPIYNRTVVLGAEKQKQKNGSNIYAVFTTKEGTVTTPEMKEAAVIWSNLLREGAYTVDNSDFAAPESGVHVNHEVAAPVILGNSGAALTPGNLY